MMHDHEGVCLNGRIRRGIAWDVVLRPMEPKIKQHNVSMF